MNNSRIIEKNCISIEFDKFKQTTTTKSKSNTNRGYGIALKIIGLNPYLQTQIRHVKSPNTDLLLIDVYYEKVGDWVFLRDGKMFLVLDGENITLDFKENFSNTFIASNTVGVKELVYCIIDKTILLKICEAKKISIRITGSQGYFDIEDEKTVDRFRIMCQQFYNNFYDETKFRNTISQNLKPKGECFIATATMGNYNHPVVIDLRIFRDEWLLKRKWGVKFTDWYYTNGSKAAMIIEKYKFLQLVSFVLIVKPLQVISKLLR